MRLLNNNTCQFRAHSNTVLFSSDSIFFRTHKMSHLIPSNETLRKVVCIVVVGIALTLFGASNHIDIGGGFFDVHEGVEAGFNVPMVHGRMISKEGRSDGERSPKYPPWDENCPVKKWVWERHRDNHDASNELESPSQDTIAQFQTMMQDQENVKKILDLLGCVEPIFL
jgi:hypothetical protein